MTTTQALRAAVLAGRVLSRALTRDGNDEAAAFVDGLADGALDSGDTYPNAPPHNGGPDWSYCEGRKIGYLMRSWLTREQRITTTTENHR